MNYPKLFSLAITILIHLQWLHAIEINPNSSNIDIMRGASIYIDHHNQLSKESVEKQTFILNDKALISLGFNPQSALWIRFTLTNSSNRSLEKTLEYANALTEEIIFFDGNQSRLKGAWHIPIKHLSMNPIFKITLMPFESKTFYIKAHSTHSTTIAQLILWNHDDFMQKEYEQKAYLLIFFTIVLTLLLYNLFIYFFTKERAYLYYIIYLFAIILNELSYSGTLQHYLLSHQGAMILSKYLILISAFLIVSMVAFTREFLHTHQFKKLDLLLKSSLYLVPILSWLSCYVPLLHVHIIFLFLPLGGLVIFVAVYALFHGVKEAQFYLLGWSILILALMLTNLQTLGVIAMNESVKYLNDIAFIAEIFLFSIALAHRIKLTNEKLTAFQAQEQQRLKKLVSLKTKELKTALDKEALLYRELNHRVKNNFQMILSLVKLQMLQATSPTIKAELLTVRDRIHAIAHLYELLEINQANPIDTQSYFHNIVQSIQQGFSHHVKVNYDIRYDLPLDKLIYCGLILNELVTNSFKYAVKEQGEIHIALYAEANHIYFVIQDNGKGYAPDGSPSHSLGLLIIQTLVEKQLLATIKTTTHKGVKNIISWQL